MFSLLLLNMAHLPIYPSTSDFRGTLAGYQVELSPLSGPTGAPTPRNPPRRLRAKHWRMAERPV